MFSPKPILEYRNSSTDQSIDRVAKQNNQLPLGHLHKHPMTIIWSLVFKMRSNPKRYHLRYHSLATKPSLNRGKLDELNSAFSRHDLKERIWYWGTILC
jgi:hypothetical protein